MKIHGTRLLLKTWDSLQALERLKRSSFTPSFLVWEALLYLTKEKLRMRFNTLNINYGKVDTLVRSTVCQLPTRDRKTRSTAWEPNCPNFHMARAEAKKQTDPSTKAGPKHAAQAHLLAHQFLILSIRWKWVVLKSLALIHKEPILIKTALK